MLTKQNVLEQLKIDEGFRSEVYQCSEGKNTIGYGLNLDDVGMAEPIAAFALGYHVDKCVQELYENFKWFEEMPDRVQGVLINMCYNIGLSRLKGFKKALAAFEAGDFQTAAAEMKDSRWYRQVGPRAQRLVRIVSGGRLS